MSLTLAATNTLQAVAGAANAITYTLYGDEIAGTPATDTFKVLGQGRVPNSVGVIYTVPAATQTLVKRATFSNTTAGAVALTLYTNGTAAANQTESFSIPANGQVVMGDEGWKTIDANGALITTAVISLTGDVSGSGVSPVSTTLATVNANVGSFGGATAVPAVTVNAKGLVTGAVSTPIQIAESQVTSLTGDLGAKVPGTRLLNTTAPLTGGGDLSTDRTLAISPATTTTAGSQSAADKKKQDDVWYDIVAQGGADPTGSVDAASIISSACSTVAAAGGGVVYIPVGTYKIGSTITISGNYVTVRGASRVASKLVPNFATGNIFTVSGIFCRFEFVRIEPASSTLRTAAYAIEFTSTASNGSCQWVDILFMWSAIKATGQLCRLEDMNIRECGYGAANGCVILIDSFTDQYLSKIVCDNGVTPPNAPQTGFSGIRITSLSSLLMSDCQIIHCGIGLEAAPASTNSIPSIYCMNTFFDQGTYGARFTPGSGTIYRCRFIGVWFSGNSVAGAQLNGASIDGLDFIGCEFYGAPSQPIGIDAVNATEWSVRASRFAGNSTSGIRTAAAANHSFSISDCTIGAVSGVTANAQGINIQAGTYKRYQVVDNRGLDTNTTKGIIDLGVVGATDQKTVANNMGTALKGAISTLAAPLSVPITTETLVLNARIPAGGVSVGQVFRIRAIGVMSAANAVTWKVKVGALGTAAGDTACWTPTIAPVGAANLRHGCEVYLTVRSLGAPGSVEAEGLQQSGATAVAITYQQPAAGAAATAAATTTADWFIDITLTQTVGTSLIQQAVIEAL